MELSKYVYDGKFSGNILVVEQIGCGKATFVEKLAIINLFGKLKEVEWISNIEMTRKKWIVQRKSL